jgi:transcription antitermination factor NusG
MAATNQGSGLRKRRPKAPGEKVEIIEGPLQGMCGTVIEQDGESVLLWLDRGMYARVHELFLKGMDRRW